MTTPFYGSSLFQARKTDQVHRHSHSHLHNLSRKSNQNHFHSHAEFHNHDHDSRDESGAAVLDRRGSTITEVIQTISVVQIIDGTGATASAQTLTGSSQTDLVDAETGSTLVVAFKNAVTGHLVRCDGDSDRVGDFHCGPRLGSTAWFYQLIHGYLDTLDVCPTRTLVNSNILFFVFTLFYPQFQFELDYFIIHVLCIFCFVIIAAIYKFFSNFFKLSVFELYLLRRVSRTFVFITSFDSDNFRELNNIIIQPALKPYIHLDRSGGGDGSSDGSGIASGTGTASAGTSSSTSASSGASSGSSTTPQTSTVVGGVFGGIAGVALLVAVAFMIMRLRKQGWCHLKLGDGADEPSAASRPLPAAGGGGGGGGGGGDAGGGNGAYGTMQQRSAPQAVAASLAALAGKRTSRERAGTGPEMAERGFVRVSGKKLPPVLQYGGDGYTDPRPGPGPGPDRSSHISDASASVYRDSIAVFDQPNHQRLALGSPMRPESGIMTMHPGPAKTPVTSQAPGHFDSPSLPRSSTFPSTDALGRTLESEGFSRETIGRTLAANDVSRDGAASRGSHTSRGSTRFTEHVD